MGKHIGTSLKSRQIVANISYAVAETHGKENFTPSTMLGELAKILDLLDNITLHANILAPLLAKKCKIFLDSVAK